MERQMSGPRPLKRRRDASSSSSTSSDTFYDSRQKKKKSTDGAGGPSKAHRDSVTSRSSVKPHATRKRHKHYISEKHKHKKQKSSQRKEKKRKRRKVHRSDNSSYSDASGSDSSDVWSSSESSGSSSDAEQEDRKRHKSKHRWRLKHKKRKNKAPKTSKSKSKHKTYEINTAPATNIPKPSLPKATTDPQQAAQKLEGDKDITGTKRGPMTREEWERQQSIVRRVYDPDTGRHRLVKGDGEIVEEIVSRDRQKSINKQATSGDSMSFQKGLKKLL